MPAPRPLTPLVQVADQRLETDGYSLVAETGIWQLPGERRCTTTVVRISNNGQTQSREQTVPVTLQFAGLGGWAQIRELEIIIHTLPTGTFSVRAYAP
jgi:hypothetical protein